MFQFLILNWKERNVGRPHDAVILFFSTVVVPAVESQYLVRFHSLRQ